MTLAAIGVLGTAAAGSISSMSMAGMSNTVSSTTPHWLSFLLKFGPEILIVSIVMVTISLVLRQVVYILPSLLVGALVYWGMYLQNSTIVMIVVTLLGFAAWGFFYLRTMPKRYRKIDVSAQQ